MKHILIILTIISMLVLSGCGSVMCSEAGEAGPNPSLGPDAIMSECCEGLQTITNYYKTEPCIMGAGGGSICSECGNDNCEEWENKCNCPEDCKEKDECTTDDECVTEMYNNEISGECNQGVCIYY